MIKDWKDVIMENLSVDSQSDLWLTNLDKPNQNKMYLREEITIEVEAGEIEFNYSLTTEDGEWEILTETITLNGAPHSPSIEEWAIMQEETEEQANEALKQYEEERLDSWED